MDVIMAFRYGFMDEEIYIAQSTIFKHGTARVHFLIEVLQPEAVTEGLMSDSPKSPHEAGQRAFTGQRQIMVCLAQLKLPCLLPDNGHRIGDLLQKFRDWFEITDRGDLAHYLRIRGNVDLNWKTITLR